MVTTRASTKRALCVNNIIKVMKRQASPRRVPRSKSARPGRGRKATHDNRALIAIGVKLEMPHMDLNKTITYVNDVCNNVLNWEHPAAQEKDLCYKTLRNRVVVLMKKAPWARMGPQHVSQWDGLVNESIKGLVCEVCARIKHDEDFERLQNEIQIPAPVGVMEQEEGQQVNNLEFNLEFGFTHQDYLLLPAHFVQLDPQQEDQQQQQQLQQVGGANGGGCDILQLDFFSGFDMPGAEMNYNTFGVIDDGIDFEWLCGLDLD